MKPRKCLYCEAEFIPTVKGKMYCSDKCRETAHHKRKNAKKREATVQRRTKKEKKESDLARINAEARAMGMTYGQYEGWRWWKACHS
jgi:ribosomal protein L20